MAILAGPFGTEWGFGAPDSVPISKSDRAGNELPVEANLAGEFVGSVAVRLRSLIGGTRGEYGGH